MPAFTINKNTGMFVQGRRSPRLAAAGTVRVEPRRIVFPEGEAAPSVATATAARRSPRLAAPSLDEKVVFKPIDGVVAFTAATEKVVFEVTYDPLTGKHITRTF